MEDYYRKSVGIVLINSDKQIFCGQRADIINDYWQMPQGGIENNEKYIDTAKRELLEETNIQPEKIQYIAETKNILRYIFPQELRGKFIAKEYIGQEQKWFLFKFLGDDSKIDVTKAQTVEFRNWQWQNKKFVIENAIPFKIKLYTDVLNEFENYLQ